MIDVDLNKKKITHRGCYSDNRSVSPTEIIDFSLSKLNIEL